MEYLGFICIEQKAVEVFHLALFMTIDINNNTYLILHRTSLMPPQGPVRTRTGPLKAFVVPATGTGS